MIFHVINVASFKNVNEPLNIFQDNQMRERDRLEKSRSARDAERAERKRAFKEEGDGGGGEVPSAAAVYTSKREAKNRSGCVGLSMACSLKLLLYF